MREGTVAELTRPAECAGKALSVGYRINAKWWCRDLTNGGRKAFRVTAPGLIDLLGLRDQH